MLGKIWLWFLVYYGGLSHGSFMHFRDHDIIYTPADLAQYLESPFASWMQRYYLMQPQNATAPDARVVMQQALSQRAFQYRRLLVDELRLQGRAISEIATQGEWSQRLLATRQAMADGVDVIVNACVEGEGFSAKIDLLVATEGAAIAAPRPAEKRYEPWLVRLSHKTKSGFLMQLAMQAELLAQLDQGAPTVVLVLGDGRRDRRELSALWPQYCAAKAEFVLAQQQFDSSRLPDPELASRWGQWKGYAQSVLQQRDHLRRVANIAPTHIRALNVAGITTMAQLAGTASSLAVTGISAAALSRLQLQARLQIATEQGGVAPAYEICASSADQPALATLPRPSAGDIYFDIEGFPLRPKGLEYLWGCAYFDEHNQRQYRDWWAHDAEQEQQALVDFLQWTHSRWLAQPDLHVFHYGHYELSACRRLSARYKQVQPLLAELVKARVFVDVFTLLKANLVLGTPSYSLKQVERLYRPQRATAVASAEDSVGVYDLWRTQQLVAQAGGELQAGKVTGQLAGSDHFVAATDAWQSQPQLQTLRQYNRDDCYSTAELVAWLRQQQALLGDCAATNSDEQSV